MRIQGDSKMATLSEAFRDWTGEMKSKCLNTGACKNGAKHRLHFIVTENLYGRYWECRNCSLTWAKVLGCDCVTGGFENGY